jgi:hypothetical protein
MDNFFRAQILCAVIDHDDEIKKDPLNIEFLYEVDGNTSDDIYSYNQILDFIEQDNLDFDSGTEQLYRFRCISAHQGPICTSD